jgi:hypothetical protein
MILKCNKNDDKNALLMYLYMKEINKHVKRIYEKRAGNTNEKR